MTGPGRTAPPSGAPEALPDAVGSAWIWWPPALQPFVQLARLDRPIGWQLLLAPCWWSAALAGIAAKAPPNAVHLALFLIGAVAMRGAGSTFNDIVDRDLDRQVARTRARPVASGRVSARVAFAFLVGQALVGLAVLLCFNVFTIGLGIAALAPVAIYPFMKRITSWPQVVLGLAFSWGALVGWSAVFGALAWAPIALYIGAILWTMGYDTIYAVQDIADDQEIGIGSTALAFGVRVREGVGVLYGLAVAMIAVALVGVDAGPFAWAGWAGFALHLGRQILRVDRSDPASALHLFRSNRDAALILFAGLSLQALVSSGR